MACEPRRSATCNGSRSNYPMATTRGPCSTTSGTRTFRPATAVAVGVEPLCRFEQVTRGVPPGGKVPCCARAKNGQAAAAVPPRSVRKSRRRMSALLPGHSLPHVGARAVLCITANLGPEGREMGQSRLMWPDGHVRSHQQRKQAESQKRRSGQLDLIWS